MTSSQKRDPRKFKKRDVARAVNAARAAGIKVGRVDFYLETGKISVVSAVEATSDTAFDDWLGKHGASPDAGEP
jgi:hypothetical protein